MHNLNIIKLKEREAYEFMIAKVYLAKNILFSGGTTFNKFYEYCNYNSDMKKLMQKKYFITDERLNSNYEKFSNIYNFENIFLKKKNFFNIFNYDVEYQKNMILKKFASLSSNIDYCFLGFGIDGHICSLFEKSFLETNSRYEKYVLTKRYDEDFQRVSINFEFLLKIKNILVIANNEDKFKVLKKILSGKMQKCYLSKLINIYKGRIKFFYVN